MKHCVDIASLYGMIGTKTFWSKVETYAGRSSYDIAMILHNLEVQCCRSIPCYREHTEFWIWIELMVHDDHILQMSGVLLKSYPPLSSDKVMQKIPQKFRKQEQENGQVKTFRSPKLAKHIWETPGKELPRESLVRRIQESTCRIVFHG